MTTVVTFGTFDLFHYGHLRILERAAAFGDHLVVGVSTDDLNVAKKGFTPAFTQEERRAIIAAVRWVDGTFWEESLDRKRDYLVEHDADVLVMGEDWQGRFDDLRDVCEVTYLPRTPGISSTRLRQLVSHPRFGAEF